MDGPSAPSQKHARSPSRAWRLQVALEGWYHIQFSLMLRLDQLEVSGRMRFRAKPDFSSIILSFVSLPSFKLRAECTVSWGVVPLPIQEYLQTAVREQMKAWLVEVSVATHTPRARRVSR